MNLVVRAAERSLWLCFEPWVSEYTLLPGAAIEIYSEWLPADITRVAVEVMPPVRSEPDRLN